MFEKKRLQKAVRILNKYKGVHVTHLMDDVNEKIGAILLKVSDMDEDEIEARAREFYLHSRKTSYPGVGVQTSCESI